MNDFLEHADTKEIMIRIRIRIKIRRGSPSL